MTQQNDSPNLLFEQDAPEKTTDDWYTPKWVFDGLGLYFDLDVASPGDGTDFVPSRRKFTISDDGLTRAWTGLVWCNPPYSAPKKWCYRYEQYDGPAMILIRADLSTKGSSAAFAASDAIWVPSPRLQFLNGRGGECPGVNFSTILLGKGQVSVNAMKRLEKVNGTTKELK